jgi:hypothetical protein
MPKAPVSIDSGDKSMHTTDYNDLIIVMENRTNFTSMIFFPALPNKRHEVIVFDTVVCHNLKEITKTSLWDRVAAMPCVGQAVKKHEPGPC